jgi:hypothetical protein
MVETQEMDLLEVCDMRILREELNNPGKFLDSDRGEAWLKNISRNFYYTQWYNDNRSSYDLREMNALAKEILEAKYDKKDECEILDILTSKFADYSAEDKFYEEYRSEIKNELIDIHSEIEDLSETDDTIPEIDLEDWLEEWLDEIKDRVVDDLYNNDESCVTDMYSSHDKAEIVFYFGSNKLIDSVYTNRNYSDFSDLVIDDNLQSQLAAMGYSISEYRKMSGNKNKSTIKGGVRKRKQPILTPENLREIVENACSTWFDFVVYAIVPIKELIDIDVSKPIVLSRYAVATYNGSSGTFHDVNKDESLVLYPHEGKLAGLTGYTPEDICGLSQRYYTAQIKNLEGA